MFKLGDKFTRMVDIGGGVERIDHCTVTGFDNEGDICFVGADKLSRVISVFELKALIESALVDGGGE